MLVLALYNFFPKISATIMPTLTLQERGRESCWPTKRSMKEWKPPTTECVCACVCALCIAMRKKIALPVFFFFFVQKVKMLMMESQKIEGSNITYAWRVFYQDERAQFLQVLLPPLLQRQKHCGPILLENISNPHARPGWLELRSNWKKLLKETKACFWNYLL